MRIIALSVDFVPNDDDREWVGVAGNGKSCTKVRRCGDGGLAVDAKLTYPKVRFYDSTEYAQLISLRNQWMVMSCQVKGEELIHCFFLYG